MIKMLSIIINVDIKEIFDVLIILYIMIFLRIFVFLEFI